MSNTHCLDYRTCPSVLRHQCLTKQLTLLQHQRFVNETPNSTCYRSYFYISIMYNVCYTMALYGMLLFWIGAAELLEPFNPLLKFVLVKTVVFLTFWQVSTALIPHTISWITSPRVE